MDASIVEELNTFLQSGPCVEAASPLRKSCVIRLRIDGNALELTKAPSGRLQTTPALSSKPDLSFEMKREALQKLTQAKVDNAAELSILFLKRLADSNPNTAIQPSIHIGILEFVTKGYLGLFGVGGKQLMTELAKLGFGSLGKIKKLIARLRTNA